MPCTLANIIHTIYNIMGWPALHLCPSPVALDKWILLRLPTPHLLLGLIFDTGKMTVEIDADY